MLGQQEQEAPEVIDPAAEQKMVQNVLDGLLQDEESHEPKVSHQHAYLQDPTACIPAVAPLHHPAQAAGTR